MEQKPRCFLLLAIFFWTKKNDVVLKCDKSVEILIKGKAVTFVDI